MKKIIYLMAAVALMTGLEACNNESIEDTGKEAATQPTVLTLDGGSDYVSLTKGEQADWKITNCPEWVTPVAMSGEATDTIRLYIESNRQLPLRQGNITVRYGNGKTHTTRAEQNDSQPALDMRRSYAAGWGFDVRTYNDSRGLRDQIFNIQRINQYDDDIYRSEISRATDTKFFYGDDASDMQNDMKGQLSIDGKFKVFSLDVQASFGMNAINNSKRIFSWIRDITGERVVYLNALDPGKAQEKELFTTDFKKLRQEIIKSQGSDATISRLVNNYGTHYITKAELGGCYDYYYSSVYTNSSNSLNVEATLKFAYNKKFNFNADAAYENSLKDLSNEVIEKFSVKGGDNIDITNKVYAGNISTTDTDNWKKSLREGKKWELLTFTLTPISVLFPNDIAEKIDNYMDRLYYSETPITRSEK